MTAFAPMTIGADSIAPVVPGSIVPQESVGVGVRPPRGAGSTKAVVDAAELSGSVFPFHGPGSKYDDELFLPLRWMNAARNALSSAEVARGRSVARQHATVGRAYRSTTTPEIPSSQVTLP